MERLRKIDGIEIETPGGAFYAFPDVTKLCGGEKGGFVEGFGPVKGSDEMCRYLLQEARVALVPGSAFGVGRMHTHIVRHERRDSGKSAG